MDVDWHTLPGSVAFRVETILPDSVVLQVIEALEAQKERGVTFPEVYIRMEVPRLVSPEEPERERQLSPHEDGE